VAKKTLPAWWYEHRLGLTDMEGKPRPEIEALEKAIEFYVDAFIDQPKRVQRQKEDGPWAAFYQWSVEALDWSWTAPRRYRYNPIRRAGQPKELYGTTLTRRHVLANFWRSRVFNLLGRGGHARDPRFLPCPSTECSLAVAPIMALAERLEAALSRPSCPKLLRDTVLGKHRQMTPPLAQDLVLPEGERWWWVARSMDHLRYVVIDVDCKTDEDAPRLEATMRLLLGPGMPRPALVTTSKSSRGRHLWYFVSERCGPVRDDAIADVRDFAEPFEQRLRQLGFVVRPGVLEVFPRSTSAKMAMPALPFGIRSYFCGDDGLEIIEADPLRALLRWHERLGHPAAIPRITLANIRGATIQKASLRDRKLVAPMGGEDQDDDADDSSTGVSGGRPRLTHRQQILAQAQGHHGDAFQHDKNLFERGGTSGQTNKDIPSIARYLRYRSEAPNRPRPDEPVEDDAQNLRRWLPIPTGSRKETSFGQYWSQFRGRFRKALPYRSRLGVPSLRPSDLALVVDLTLRLAVGDARRRAGFFRGCCYVVGMARTHERERTPSGAIRTPVSSAVMQSVWCSRYKDVLAALAQQGIVRRIRQGVAPQDAKRGSSSRVSTYAVRLPSVPGSTTATDISGRGLLVALIDQQLSAHDVETLFPRTKDWRKLMLSGET
jgi:hypothetical protein